jgi:selenocysteine lyase/cysteine desulfurase
MPDDPAAAVFALPSGVLYLDAAAQSPRLHAALAAGHAALDAMASPWQADGGAWEATLEAVRAQAAIAIFRGDVEGLAMVPSAAHGLATAAANLPLGAGDTVLLEDTPFPSSLLTWQARCAATGAHLLVADAADGDRSTALVQALAGHRRVRVVVASQAHWVDGGLLYLDRIADAARSAGAALVLDLSQSAGALPVDVSRWQPQFVVTVGYKWLLGPHGLAWLWAAPRWRDAGTAIEQHWQARDAGPGWRFATDAPTPYRSGARRFDAGGIATGPALAMAAAGLAQLQAWETGHVERTLRARVSRLHDALDAVGLADWRLPHAAAHFTAVRPPPDRLDVASQALRQAGIMCTTRHGVIRIAPHLHIAPTDMDRVAEVLARVPGA